MPNGPSKWFHHKAPVQHFWAPYNLGGSSLHVVVSSSKKIITPLSQLHFFTRVEDKYIVSSRIFIIKPPKTYYQLHPSFQIVGCSNVDKNEITYNLIATTLLTRREGSSFMINTPSTIPKKRNFYAMVTIPLHKKYPWQSFPQNVTYICK